MKNEMDDRHGWHKARDEKEDSEKEEVKEYDRGRNHYKWKFDGCEVSEAQKKQKVEDGGVCHINDLPPEVIRVIFSYLSVYDKLSASVVCKYWLHIMDNPMLVNDIQIKIRASTLPNLWKLDGQLVYWSRRFGSLLLWQIEISSHFLNFLHAYGKNVKSLKFMYCNLYEPLNHSCKDGIYFPNLHSLEFEGYDLKVLNIFGALPCLKNLHVGDRVTDYELVYWSKIMPQLESVRFKLRQYIFDSDDKIRAIYGDTMSWSTNPSVQFLTSPAIRNFIKTHSETLTEFLLLGEYGRSLKIFSAMLPEMNDLKLSKIRIDYTLLNKSKSSVIEIIRSFPTLTQIELHDVELQEDQVRSICTSLPNLQVLDITGRWISFELSLKDIIKLKHLRRLKLLTGTIKDVDIDNFQLHRLKHLEIINVNFDNQALLRSFLGSTKELRTLVLHPTEGIEDETLRCICENLLRLHTLDVKAKKLTDDSIFSSTNPKHCLSNIKELKCLRVENLDNSAVSQEAFLKAIKFLKLYKLEFWCDVSNKSENLKLILKLQMPHLRWLEITCM